MGAEEVEGGWDDTDYDEFDFDDPDAGFFERVYGSSIGPDAEAQAGPAEEGEDCGDETEAQAWPTEEDEDRSAETQTRETEEDCRTDRGGSTDCGTRSAEAQTGKTEEDRDSRYFPIQQIHLSLQLGLIPHGHMIRLLFSGLPALLFSILISNEGRRK